MESMHIIIKVSAFLDRESPEYNNPTPGVMRKTKADASTMKPIEGVGAPGSVIPPSKAGVDIMMVLFPLSDSFSFFVEISF